jgi:UDP-N-acetylmuramate dehydrogenase
MLTLHKDIQRYLRSNGIPFVTNALLSACSTWRIGGPADHLVEPSSWEQVAQLIKFATDIGIPTIVIGKGSNLLFDDAGFRGVVVTVGRNLSGITINGTRVHVESGISASRLARSVGLAGLAGLEHIVGIPGTLGGLICMNGGSQRKTIGERVVEVKTIDRGGNIRVFEKNECNFGYRRSRFQSGDCVIAETTMDLFCSQPDNIMGDMLRLLRDRRQKLPLTSASCGSVFKSDPRWYDTFGSPGKIIESVRLKGVSVGDAVVSHRHGNFIVNEASAKAQDVLSLIELIRERVAREIGIRLECEVRFVESRGIIRSP